MRLGLILTIWSVSGYIHAQPISGKVVDSIDGSGLPGATILITGTNDLGVISALDGSFEITHDLEAEDSLTISFVGYHRQVVSYSDMVLDSIVKLRPTALSLSQVTVKADRLVAEEFNLKQIKKLDIYRNPSAKADPLLAVNAMPSSTTIDESANISLRGSPPGETGIFINNVPLYDAVRFSQLNGIGTFSIFSTGIIRDVTVFPGNPPLEFGNVASGVVSLRTNSQQVKANQTSLTISPASFGIQLSRRVNDQSSIDIFGNYQPSGLLTAINSEALNGVREFNSKDLGANFRLITKKRSSLRVFAYGNTERYTFDFKSPSFNGIFHQDKKRAYLVSNYKKNFSQSAVGMDLGISISDNQFSFSSSTRNLYNQDHFIGLYHQLFFKTWSLKYGATRDARQFDLQGTFHQ
ncbi:MAG: TonB-dependent receptor, partial [Cyclobacteriaceae bacterium]|nr:TonB-dependent receptor [Cyclobacteriaceae bacterium HetDA_MAG_MS6]